MAESQAGTVKTAGFTILGVIVALGGVAMVLTSGLAASVSATHPDGLASLAHSSAAGIREHLALALVPQRGMKIPLRDADEAGRLLRRAPLDPDAQTYLGLVADEKGDHARARSLMEQAVRADGRSLRARLWLLGDALRRRDYATAIGHFDRMIEITPTSRPVMIQAMTAIVGDPASHAPLAAKLATNPEWRSDFLYDVNQHGMSADTIFQLTARNSAQQSALIEQSALLQSLVAKKEFERAYLAWVNFLPESSLKQIGSIYDPQFRNLPGPEPFNWQLSSDTDGVAEFRQPAGLTISYLGARQATLASQVIVLPPGHYILSSVAAGDDKYDQLSWALSCLEGNTSVQAMRLTKLADARRKYAVAFDIPASGCVGQRLSLTGLPGEFPRTASAEIDSVSIEPAK